MSSITWSEQLDLMIRSRSSLIWIRSNEEARVETLLEQAASRLNDQLGSWNFIDGLQGILNGEGLGARQPMAVLQWLRDLDSSSPTLLLVKDFHRFCDDPGIARMLRNLQQSLRSTPHSLIVCCGSWTPPADLDEALMLLDLPLDSTICGSCWAASVRALERLLSLLFSSNSPACRSERVVSARWPPVLWQDAPTWSGRS